MKAVAIDAGILEDKAFQRLSERDQRRFLMLACLKAKGGLEPTDEEVCKALGIHMEGWIQTRSRLSILGLIDSYNALTSDLARAMDLSPAKPSSVPCDEIIQIYDEVMPKHLARPRKPATQIKKHMAARWNEDKERRSLEWWGRYFEFAAESPFLIGDNDRGWLANLLWLVGRCNMEKVLSGNYHHSKKPARLTSNVSAAKEWLKK